MEYTTKPDKSGVSVVVDLPLEITKSNQSFEYFDSTLNKMRSTHPDYWVVNESEDTPKNMDCPTKEFKDVDNAVEYARTTYLAYLRAELKRVRFKDEG